MASYKQPCMQCNSLIDRDAQFCPVCGSMNAFGYHCPDCLKTIQKGQRICTECGRILYTSCPYCGQKTFVQDRCEVCGQSLMVRCENIRCGVLQFFENTKCTACGRKMLARNKT